MAELAPIGTRRRALIDLAMIVGLLVTLKAIVLQYDALWSFAGPISLLAALGLASLCLRRDGQSWMALGLRRPPHLWLAAGQTAFALLITLSVGALASSLTPLIFGQPDAATQAIDARFQGRFSEVPGNVSAYLVWLAIAWVIGGFCEEMLFRAALVNRLEQVFTNMPFKSVAAVALQAVLFGQQHYYYQGLTGWVATGAIGLVSGLLYLGFKRSLWPLILSHGLSNTIGLSLIYLGLDQGLP